MSRRAWSAFAAMSLLWGVSYLLIKIAIDGGMPALDVAWLRVALAAVLLLALAGRGGHLGALRGRWRWVAAYAVAEISIPFPLIAAGEVHVASSLAAIIIAAVPLIGAVLALRFDHSERPTPLRALGLAIGFSGVIALVGIDIAGSGTELLGAAAILTAAVGYAIGPMLVKHRLAGLDPRAMMGASLALAGIILAPFAAADLPRRAPTAGAWAAVGALGVFCTAVAFVIFAVLIREAGTSRATVITYVNPIVAVALGVTLLGERPGAGAVAGLLLILAGSWLSTGGRMGGRMGGRGRSPVRVTALRRGRARPAAGGETARGGPPALMTNR
jgi:drug/metabolite transporter (DMT)-like permease